MMNKSRVSFLVPRMSVHPSQHNCSCSSINPVSVSNRFCRCPNIEENGLETG